MARRALVPQGRPQGPPDRCRAGSAGLGERVALHGLYTSIASRWLVPRLSDFTARLPEIAIRVAYAKAEDRRDDGDNDIPFGADPSPRASSLKLFSRVSNPACSPHYLARKGQLGTPADIAAWLI